MRVLAIDWGRKKIGLAIGDTQFKIAAPFKNIPNNKDSISSIINVIKNYSIDIVLIGRPVLPISQKPNELFPFIKKFAKDLKKRIKEEFKKDIKVYFIEEEYTSEIAKIKFGVKKDIDKYSALIMIDQFLEKNENEKL